MADTGASSSSAVDPTSSVPVLVSIKYLDGENQGHINYHYLFPPPPVWVMSEHGLKIFAVVDCPLLTADKQEEKEHLLDLDIGEVLYLMEESLMDFYSLDAEDVGLDSDECAIFVTEYDEVEVRIYCYYSSCTALFQRNGC